MTLADLARLVAAEADFDAQWRLVVEFLKEYHQEPAGIRLGLLGSPSILPCGTARLRRAGRLPAG